MLQEHEQGKHKIGYTAIQYTKFLKSHRKLKCLSCNSIGGFEKICDPDAVPITHEYTLLECKTCHKAFEIADGIGYDRQSERTHNHLLATRKRNGF